ncbi:hypothetical protein COCSUDRAFT_62396 [Coccomyxa subellipsoidea C-169]|uniref:Uncharacterized protein n=1 Tax=Coccomyxa subellipsoidea (strain C-169) TaxID=574566 RepID=I0YZP7_COCSC|nr:hypothetical protein COCSUDRAFT_62396 [Coccomyxa subellipsoidea C-169]EIE23866.1 hypothetical protein COCSUDRAFT_62396 [Coccomyxa subellipsoidea C-169]|eukprot:XP_005648410.1 hypothetical protein COCSUDRAFT_62396 [Coccomyxa subellipsoidea C-169]
MNRRSTQEGDKDDRSPTHYGYYATPCIRDWGLGETSRSSNPPTYAAPPAPKKKPRPAGARATVNGGRTVRNLYPEFMEAYDWTRLRAEVEICHMEVYPATLEQPSAPLASQAMLLAAAL